jgi:lysylphosphatidylglycerol synthetase-like protein (DUF2156 family)
MHDTFDNYFGCNIDSAVILAIITAGCYFTSIYSVDLALGRIGIDPSLYNLTAEEYLISNIIPLVISLGVCLAFIYAMNSKDNRFTIFLSYLPVIVGAFSIIYLFILSDFALEVAALVKICLEIFIIFFIILISYIIVLSCLKKINVIKTFWVRNIFIRIFIISTILMILAIMSAAYGYYSAPQAIECNHIVCIHVNFTFEDSNLSAINAQNLILIGHHDGKYFVTTQQRPAPINPIVYVISDDQVEEVKMRGVENWSDQTELSL